MASEHGSRQVPTFCALCVARCGAKATITDGVFVAPQPDPSHPAGQALCVKGKAGPELVNHPERLLYPLRRTEPKGAADPGWQRITWEEALDTVSARLLAPSAAGSRPTSRRWTNAPLLVRRDTGRAGAGLTGGRDTPRAHRRAARVHYRSNRRAASCSGS